MRYSEILEAQRVREAASEIEKRLKAQQKLKDAQWWRRRA